SCSQQWLEIWYNREVEEILSDRTIRRRGVLSYKEYLIKWRDLPDSDASWEAKDLLVLVTPVTTGSVVVTPGSVITTGSILVTPGSVITTGSILVTPGSVITTGSILVTPGSVITTGSIFSNSVRDPIRNRNGGGKKALAWIWMQ
ncbi:2-(3-amino-3-carboxypropyl)histidine synthase subunit 2-like protein, partial [Tanacetum coccineum]